MSVARVDDELGNLGVYMLKSSKTLYTLSHGYRS